MEQSLFPLPAVQSEFEKFVRVELFLDAKTPEAEVRRSERNIEFQWELFGHNEMPFYAILEPDGRTVIATQSFTQSSAEFLAFLRKGS